MADENIASSDVSGLAQYYIGAAKFRSYNTFFDCLDNQIHQFRQPNFPASPRDRDGERKSDVAHQDGQHIVISTSSPMRLGLEIYQSDQGTTSGGETTKTVLETTSKSPRMSGNLINLDSLQSSPRCVLTAETDNVTNSATCPTTLCSSSDHPLYDDLTPVDHSNSQVVSNSCPETSSCNRVAKHIPESEKRTSEPDQSQLACYENDAPTRQAPSTLNHTASKPIYTAVCNQQHELNIPPILPLTSHISSRPLPSQNVSQVSQQQPNSTINEQGNKQHEDTVPTLPLYPDRIAKMKSFSPRSIQRGNYTDSCSSSNTNSPRHASFYPLSKTSSISNCSEKLNPHNKQQMQLNKLEQQALGMLGVPREIIQVAPASENEDTVSSTSYCHSPFEKLRYRPKSGHRRKDHQTLSSTSKDNAGLRPYPVKDIPTGGIHVGDNSGGMIQVKNPMQNQKIIITSTPTSHRISFDAVPKGGSGEVGQQSPATDPRDNISKEQHVFIKSPRGSEHLIVSRPSNSNRKQTFLIESPNDNEICEEKQIPRNTDTSTPRDAVTSPSRNTATSSLHKAAILSPRNTASFSACNASTASPRYAATFSPRYVRTSSPRNNVMTSTRNTDTPSLHNAPISPSPNVATSPRNASKSPSRHAPTSSPQYEISMRHSATTNNGTTSNMDEPVAHVARNETSYSTLPTVKTCLPPNIVDNEVSMINQSNSNERPEPSPRTKEYHERNVKAPRERTNRANETEIRSNIDSHSHTERDDDVKGTNKDQVKTQGKTVHAHIDNRQEKVAELCSIQTRSPESKSRTASRSDNETEDNPYEATYNNSNNAASSTETTYEKKPRGKTTNDPVSSAKKLTETIELHLSGQTPHAQLTGNSACDNTATDQNPRLHGPSTEEAVLRRASRGMNTDSAVPQRGSSLDSLTDSLCGLIDIITVKLKQSSRSRRRGSVSGDDDNCSHATNADQHRKRTPNRQHVDVDRRDVAPMSRGFDQTNTECRPNIDSNLPERTATDKLRRNGHGSGWGQRHQVPDVSKQDRRGDGFNVSQTTPEPCDLSGPTHTPHKSDSSESASDASTNSQRSRDRTCHKNNRRGERTNNAVAMETTPRSRSHSPIVCLSEMSVSSEQSQCTEREDRPRNLHRQFAKTRSRLSKNRTALLEDLYLDSNANMPNRITDAVGADIQNRTSFDLKRESVATSESETDRQHRTSESSRASDQGESRMEYNHNAEGQRAYDDSKLGLPQHSRTTGQMISTVDTRDATPSRVIMGCWSVANTRMNRPNSRLHGNRDRRDVVNSSMQPRGGFGDNPSRRYGTGGVGTPNQMPPFNSRVGCVMAGTFVGIRNKRENESVPFTNPMADTFAGVRNKRENESIPSTNSMVRDASEAPGTHHKNQSMKMRSTKHVRYQPYDIRASRLISEDVNMSHRNRCKQGPWRVDLLGTGHDATSNGPLSLGESVANDLRPSENVRLEAYRNVEEPTHPHPESKLNDALCLSAENSTVLSSDTEPGTTLEKQLHEKAVSKEENKNDVENDKQSPRFNSEHYQKAGWTDPSGITSPYQGVGLSITDESSMQITQLHCSEGTSEGDSHTDPHTNENSNQHTNEHTSPVQSTQKPYVDKRRAWLRFVVFVIFVATVISVYVWWSGHFFKRIEEVNYFVEISYAIYRFLLLYTTS